MKEEKEEWKMLAPLYVQTVYSLLSSLITIDEYIQYAKNAHLSSLVICDNQMFGTMPFIKKCQENGIRPIIGLEIKMENHIVLAYAKNGQGYTSLIKLSTIQSEKEVTKENLLENRNGLILIPLDDIELYQELKEAGENDLYFGMTKKLEESVLEKIGAKRIDIKKINYLKKRDKEYLLYLKLIKEGKTLQGIKEEKNLSEEELTYCVEDKDILVEEDISLKNHEEILFSCHLDLPKGENLLPIYPTENPHEYLTTLSKKGLSKRLGGVIPEIYEKRLAYELATIERMGFSNYFLVVYDYIRYAKINGILVGPGRGSAVGSLTAFCLGITDIDPIKYDLLFERFLNPERITMPDIDTDFPDIYRDQVIDYVKEKYGENRVCGIVTFGTLAAKQAIRDVSRILNIPTFKVDAITKRIPTVTKWKLKDFYEQDTTLKEMIDEDKDLVMMYKIASRIEGFPRHTSSHASGIVMSRIDLNEVIPLTRNEDLYLTGYTMEYLEELGLLKMDFLGLKNLTTIMNIMKNIEEGEGKKISFQAIPLEDEITMKLFQKADTTGIFQFESAGMRAFLRNLHPNTFEDIFSAIALFRPGPASNIDAFIRRKEGQEEVTYLDKSLEPILKNTYGIIVYQEQIMQVSQVFAGYTLGEADILRRAMSKKKQEILQKEEARFLKRSIERGHSQEVSKEVYDLILNFANYGFNRSHSVAYSIIAFKMAFLKARFPKYFYASLLTSVIGVEAKTREYIQEIRGKGIAILKPDINMSEEYYKTEEAGIRFPLSSIKNIGVASCKDIIEKRKDGPYQDIFDFLSRITPRIINKKVLESLIDADCFQNFGYNHQTLYKNLDALMNYASLTKELEEEFVLKPEIVVEEEFEKEILLAKEKELFGLYLTHHPVTEYKAKENNQISLEAIATFFNQKITILVLVEKVKKVMTKKQEEMAFVSVSDESDTLEVIVFPKLLREKPLRVGNIIKVYGRIEKRYDSYQILADTIEILNEKSKK